MEPYVNISTKKKTTPTTHPQPPSGASGYTLGPKKCNHLAPKYAMFCWLKKAELANVVNQQETPVFKLAY